VLHIGGHLGLEATTYNQLGKQAIFIEADPDIFLELQKNLSSYDNQHAHNILLGDSDQIVKFYRANNNAESSSVFPFSEQNRFANVSTDFVHEMPMKRLDSCFREKDLRDYDHWIIDVQGAELLVLKGAGKLLDICQTIYIECSTTEFYEGGVLWSELSEFLRNAGFKYFVSPGPISHLNVIFFRA
jgi:FkbM family methyltransferase